MDDVEILKDVHHTLSELKVDFQSYIRTGDDKAFIEKVYPGWSGAIPASILYDGKGKIINAWMGTKTLEEFEAIVKKHL